MTLSLVWFISTQHDDGLSIISNLASMQRAFFICSVLFLSPGVLLWRTIQIQNMGK